LPIAEPVALYCAVAAGTVIGGLLRSLASMGVVAVAGTGFPWGTLLVNVAGSFVIGFYATLTGPDGRFFPGSRQRQFIMTGICGGFTTFSMFSLETLRLVNSGALLYALGNIVLSVTAWLAAVWLGHAAALRLNQLRGT
jgi:CrcB protein